MEVFSKIQIYKICKSPVKIIILQVFCSCRYTSRWNSYSSLQSGSESSAGREFYSLLYIYIDFTQADICNHTYIYTHIQLLDFGRALARKGHVYWDPKYSLFLSRGD